MSAKNCIADKETLDKLYNLLAPEMIWGFIEHMDIKSPTQRITPIGINKNYKNVSRDTITGELNLNSWADFPIVMSNKPYMVRSDGTPDYMLDENDYTKKADGSVSDVANISYQGGAFSWIPRIYKHEHMEGSDRVVMFSMIKREGYEPAGFIDPANNVLEGAWLPMFYGSILNPDTTPKMVSLAGLQPSYSKNAAAQKTAIDGFSARARFLGGPLIETLTDILMMMAGTTDLQAAYGYGNSNGYDVSLTPTMGVKQNQIVGGGQFYGTDDKKSLNKIFHSIVLASYQQWLRDPYEMVVNGRVKVSKNYTYDITGASYEDVGINVPNAETGNELSYPLRYQSVTGYGSIPAVEFTGGSTSTGSCDGFWRSASQDTTTAISLRLGSCNSGLLAGLRNRRWNHIATFADWSVCAAVLLQPPVGVSA